MPYVPFKQAGHWRITASYCYQGSYFTSCSERKAGVMIELGWMNRVDFVYDVSMHLHVHLEPIYHF